MQPEVQRQQQARPTTNGHARPPEWPTPRPLPSDLQPVPAYSARLLPSPLAERVTDVARRTGCPPEFVAVTLLTALGTLIGRRLGIQPKRLDPWQVVPNNWAMLVGDPSAGKSPAMTAALAPFRKLDDRWAIDNDRARAAYEIDAEVAGARHERNRDRLRKHAGDATEEEVVRRDIEAEPAIAPPKSKRLIVQDATIEKLGMIHADNPTGILLVRDELAGWLAAFEKSGREGDRQLFLESWNGQTAHSVDRVSRGSLRLAATCIGIVGGIQPGRLRGYLDDAITGGAGDDGFVQRFQFSVWPDVDPNAIDLDEAPDLAAAEGVERLVAAIGDNALGLPPSDGSLPVVGLATDGAQEKLDAWRAENVKRSRSSEEHAVMRAHLVKARETAPGLALILEVVARLHAGHRVEAVSLRSVSLALAWMDLFECHARRIYAIESSEVAPARRLLKKLNEGAILTGFTPRELKQQEWSGLRGPDADLAISGLVRFGWLRAAQRSAGPQGGRPSVEYLVHPAARGGAK